MGKDNSSGVAGRPTRCQFPTSATAHQPVLAPVALSLELKTLVGLLNDGASASADACPPIAFAEWCQRNKYPLVALEAWHDTPMWADAVFAELYEAERERLETQRREYLLVRDAWLARGISCLMIKSAGEHPAFPYTSDNIDILVLPERGVAAREVLRELGYVEVRNVEEPLKFLFRKFHDGRCVSAIHLHERIAWFVEFLDTAAVWQRLRPAADDPRVNVPSPEDAILINLAHACYENKLLRLNDVWRVRQGLSDGGSALDWEYLQCVAASRGWRDGLAFMLLVYAWVECCLFGNSLIPRTRRKQLEACISHDRAIVRRLAAIRSNTTLDLPLDLSYLFCKRLYYRKILADTTRSHRERLTDTARTLIWGLRLKSGIRPQPGFVVSLSGLDGSGKTTQARALVNGLGMCEIRTDYVWSRGGSTGLLSFISAIRRRRCSSPHVRDRTQIDALARRRERLGNPAARLAWSWLVAFDQIVTDVARVRLPAMRGRVVVTDRCVYDTAVEMDASLPDEARWSRLAIKVMLRLVRPSNLGYLLDISPEAARARKTGEIWHSDFDEERERYLKLAADRHLRLLSTDGPFAESNDLLIRDVMTSYMRGYETRLNALFLSNPSQKNAPDQIWEGSAR